ncbi:MAG: hypothetical protein KIS94_05555 [Chitinophagales bacterium]|nr:hypothetical protein [Chitinophagales bacterium]
MAVKTNEQVAYDLAMAGKFFDQLTGVAQGIATSITTGATVGTAASGVGLAVVFFQQMVNTISSAEMAKKFHTLKMEWQADELQDMFAYNKLQEELIQEKIRNELIQYENNTRNNIKEAQLLHVALAVTIIIVVIIAVLLILFFRKQ